MGTWNNLGTKEELYSTFFATIKNLGTKEDFFFNFGACSMKCDNLGENNAVKEFGEIEGTTCEPFFCVWYQSKQCCDLACLGNDKT